MKVDTTDKVSVGRKSVRIHSTYIFNGGLILIDAKHMPTGCGTWGAAWANGPDWPNGGEVRELGNIDERVPGQSTYRF